ncbi:MAG TPA: tRNA lysidine(34) synthetase TilS [Planctomycetota bacterium]|nr:tRNA lysidine(34) synthetase TilS [Planctomycetota bacterium]
MTIAEPCRPLRLASRALLPRGARVLLAVSGGSDSVALLAAARAQLDGPFEVAHVHHGLRAAADRDAAFVQDLCARLGLACHVLHAPPTAADPARHETAARRRRLAALALQARRLQAPFILLAHHLDDDLETLLLRLRRGHSGDRALAGMPVLRPLAPGVLLLRPFLALAAPPGRAELRAGREAAGLPHVEDESNADLRVPRNALRAWLASQPPSTRSELLALRAAARARLQRRVLAAAAQLELHLREEGLGARLALRALQAPPGEPRAEFVAEVLRLLGLALQRPRRLDPRAAVLRQLDERLRRGGELLLPAEPAPLRVLLHGDVLRLPDDAPAAGEPAARAVGALLAG